MIHIHVHSCVFSLYALHICVHSPVTPRTCVCRAGVEGVSGGSQQHCAAPELEAVVQHVHPHTASHHHPPPASLGVVVPPQEAAGLVGRGRRDDGRGSARRGRRWGWRQERPRARAGEQHTLRNASRGALRHETLGTGQLVARASAHATKEPNLSKRKDKYRNSFWFIELDAWALFNF